MPVTTKNFCSYCGLPADLEGNCPDSKCPAFTVNSLQDSTVGNKLVNYKKASLISRFIGTGIEFTLFFGLELIGLILTPLTVISSSITSIFIIIITLVKDLEGASYDPFKRIFGLSLIDERTGEKATNKQAILRNLPYLVCWALSIFPDPIGLLGLFLLLPLLFIDSYLILMDSKGRKLGDRIVGTQVIKTPRD